MLNTGVRQARGEYLVLMHDDVTPRTNDWIESMLEFLQYPELGAVGPKLLFPDGRLQSVGYVLLEGVPRRPWYGFPGHHPGYHCGNRIYRNCLAVPGACLMTKRSAFEAVAALCEDYVQDYWDADYCLRLRQKGLRVLFTAYAEMVHSEEATRAGWPQGQLESFRKAWGASVLRDPYYNPNLDHTGRDYCVNMEGVQ
jgi:GT2 family glycosyltransferase